MLVNMSSVNEVDPEDSSDSESSVDDEDDNFQGFDDTDTEGSTEADHSDVEEREDEDGEDVLVSTIAARKEITVTQPSPIRSEDLFTDLSFHPSCDIIAMSSLSGNIEVYSYNLEENTIKGTIEAHIKSCRAVEFSSDGKTLYSIGQDRNVVFSDLETLDMKMFINAAHHQPMTALSVPDENILVTGDEEGVIKIWDPRYIHTPTFKAHDAHDYISCIVAKESYKIACTSGDGTLTSYDFRANKMLHQSSPFETDLTCCTSTHNDTMLVCGTMTGQFLFYKWTDFSDIAGTYKPAQKFPVNSLLQVSDNMVLSGMEDGHIRAYYFFPHKDIGIVGQHTLNVERLDISHDGSFVASLSPDPIVKFWNISYLDGFEVNEAQTTKSKSNTNLPSSEFDDRKSFFADLS